MPGDEKYDRGLVVRERNHARLVQRGTRAAAGAYHTDKRDGSRQSMQCKRCNGGGALHPRPHLSILRAGARTCNTGWRMRRRCLCDFEPMSSTMFGSDLRETRDDDLGKRGVIVE